MSVKIDNATVTTIPSVITCPTLAVSDNSTKLATTQYVYNYVTNVGIVINNSAVASYTVTGIKTFTDLLFSGAIGAYNGLTITIAPTVATTINLLFNTTQTLNLLGIAQIFSSTWNSPIVTNSFNTTKVFWGIINVTVTTGVQGTFSTPFSVGCVPIMIGNVSGNATPNVTVFFNVTNTTFYCGCSAVKNVTWIAIGY
jgi:hypothetical protein